MTSSSSFAPESITASEDKRHWWCQVWSGGEDPWCKNSAKRKDLCCKGCWNSLSLAEKENWSLFTEKHRESYQKSYESAEPSVGNPRYDAFFNKVTNREQSIAHHDDRDDAIANLQREVNFWKSRAEANFANVKGGEKGCGPMIGRAVEKGYGQREEPRMQNWGTGSGIGEGKGYGQREEPRMQIWATGSGRGEEKGYVPIIGKGRMQREEPRHMEW